MCIRIALANHLNVAMRGRRKRVHAYRQCIPGLKLTPLDREHVVETNVQTSCLLSRATCIQDTESLHVSASRKSQNTINLMRKFVLQVRL